MSKRPISLANVRERLDRISADIEKATEKGFLAAALDLKLLESELSDATPQPIQLLTHISSARAELGLGKLEAAQDLISGALFFTEPGAKGLQRGNLRDLLPSPYELNALGGIGDEPLRTHEKGRARRIDHDHAPHSHGES